VTIVSKEAVVEPAVGETAVIRNGAGGTVVVVVEFEPLWVDVPGLPPALA
jgi:hypothetical protein